MTTQALLDDAHTYAKALSGLDRSDLSIAEALYVHVASALYAPVISALDEAVDVTEVIQVFCDLDGSNLNEGKAGIVLRYVAHALSAHDGLHWPPAKVAHALRNGLNLTATRGAL